MTRNENLQAMQALHVAAYTAPSAEAGLNIHKAYYLASDYWSNVKR